MGGRVGHVVKKNKAMVPPPASREDDDLRTSFARTALANVSLMSGVSSPKEAAIRAMQIAEEMLCALRRRNSSLPKIKAVSEAEMCDWEREIEKKNAKERPTVRSPSKQIARITPTRIITPVQIPMTEEIPKSLCNEGAVNSRPTKSLKGPGVYKHLREDD